MELKKYLKLQKLVRDVTLIGLILYGFKIDNANFYYFLLRYKELVLALAKFF